MSLFQKIVFTNLELIIFFNFFVYQLIFSGK